MPLLAGGRRVRLSADAGEVARPRRAGWSRARDAGRSAGERDRERIERAFPRLDSEEPGAV